MSGMIMLVKISRAAAWILLFLIIPFIISGYSMTGKYGMDRIIDTGTALRIHTGFSELLVFFLIIHVSINIYLALVRWGVIRRKK